MKRNGKRTYNQQQMKAYLDKSAIFMPKTRASKIYRFKHYSTDAPV